MKLLMYSKRMMNIKEFCNGYRDLNYPSTLSFLKFCPDVHTYAHTHSDTYVCVCIYICISLYAHISIPVLKHTNTHSYMHTCMYACQHTDTHTHIHTHTAYVLTLLTLSPQVLDICFSCSTLPSHLHTPHSSFQVWILSSLSLQLVPFQQLQQTSALFSESNFIKFPCSCSWNTLWLPTCMSFFPKTSAFQGWHDYIDGGKSALSH